MLLVLAQLCLRLHPFGDVLQAAFVVHYLAVVESYSSRSVANPDDTAIIAAHLDLKITHYPFALHKRLPVHAVFRGYVHAGRAGGQVVLPAWVAQHMHQSRIGVDGLSRWRGPVQPHRNTVKQSTVALFTLL